MVPPSTMTTIVPKTPKRIAPKDIDDNFSLLSFILTPSEQEPYLFSGLILRGLAGGVRHL